MKYKIKFEMYGKKMKTTIEASSKNEAISMLKNRIIIHDVSEDNDEDIVDNPFMDGSVEYLKNIFGIK